jgi:hypothetical protein
MGDRKVMHEGRFKWPCFACRLPVRRLVNSLRFRPLGENIVRCFLLSGESLINKKVEHINRYNGIIHFFRSPTRCYNPLV